MSSKTNYVKRTDLIPLSVLEKILVSVEDAGEISQAELLKQLAGYSTQTVASSIGRLIQRGWLTARKNGVRILPAGDRYLTYLLSTLQLLDDQWDTTLIFVATRVHKRSKTKRDLFRKFLIQHGYGHILDGGWVHPRPQLELLEREIERLAINDLAVIIRSQPIQRETVQKIITWGWHWDRLRMTLTDFVEHYRPIIRAVIDAQSLIASDEQRVIGKWVVLAYAKLLGAHPNFPEDLLPESTVYRGARELYQLIRPYCYR